MVLGPPARQRLAAIAEDQWGLLTRQQAAQAGMAPATLARLTRDGSVLERVAHGVYHLAGAPPPDHLELRAAWLQLAPGTLAWDRVADQGVVSHRSAAALYGIGHLPADRHEFTIPRRHQTRRADVRLHRRPLPDGDWLNLRGMLVTRPARTASDLLAEGEDAEAVAHLIADAIRAGSDDPGTFTGSLAAHAARFGLRRGDGIGLLRWFLELVGDPGTSRWLEDASAHLRRGVSRVEPEAGAVRRT